MSGIGFLVVGVGVVLGVWLCWVFVILLNVINLVLLYGMLVVNLVGGYLIGIVVGFFDMYVGLLLEWCLFVIIGFLGGLMMFFIFLSEVVVNILVGDYLMGVLYIVVYLGGLLFFMMFGFWMVCMFS